LHYLVDGHGKIVAIAAPRQHDVFAMLGWSR
jgi:DNA-binding transcriptional ArsR family regulator